MYRSNREVFQLKKGSKRPVESNLDNIINQAQIKMKEMISEKQEIDRKTNTLIGQENVLNENINELKNQINDKKQTIASMNEKLNETKEEIKKLEKENKKVIKEANVKEAKLKDDINGINNELEKIKYGTLPAEAQKVFALKKACDEVVSLKDENNKLREKLYLLSRRLYSLEVSFIFFIYLNIQMEYNDTMDAQKISAIKAQRGIENLEELYSQIQDEDEGEGEGDEGGESNGNENEQKNGQQVKLIKYNWILII